VSPRGDFDLTPFAEPIDGSTVKAVQQLCARHRTRIIAPLVLAESGCLYNASILVGAGGVETVYRKRHPWVPEQWATPGRDPVRLVEISGIKTALAICYDGHFLPWDADEVLTRARLLVFTSAWVDDEEESRLPLLRGIAQNFDVVVANANWGPGVVHVKGQGGSCILDPRGEAIATVMSPRRRANAAISEILCEAR
jgi:predicted amidohydrolase